MAGWNLAPFPAILAPLLAASAARPTTTLPVTVAPPDGSAKAAAPANAPPAERVLPSPGEAEPPRPAEFLSTDSTRLTNPPATLRGYGWNRWEPLPCNPQDRALRPAGAANPLAQAKDLHRPAGRQAGGADPEPAGDGSDYAPVWE